MGEGLESCGLEMRERGREVNVWVVLCCMGI